jgi:hypothetical protein
MNIGDKIQGKVICSTDDRISKRKTYVVVEFEGYYPVILVSKK